MRSLLYCRAGRQDHPNKEGFSLDIELHDTEAGQGKPLILLHGNGENNGYFKNQIPVFATRFHVFAPDTRGHGQTPRGEGAFTIRRFADDLAGFMDRHGLSRAHLLGFSDGANIAMCFALKYPERVDKLILNGGNLTPRGVKARYQLPIEIGYYAARLFSGKDERAKAKAELLGLMVNDPFLSPHELAGIRAQTLVIAGTRDMIRTRHTRLIARSIPGAKLLFLKGDHFIAAKQSAAFNRAVLDFL